MEKSFSRLGSLWPPPWRRQISRERRDAEKNARAHVKVVTETDPISFVVEGDSYVATQGFLSPCFAEGQDRTLATLMHVKSRAITRDWILQLVNDWLARDDVFVRSFLSTIMFFGAHMSEVVVKDDACDLLRDWGSQYTMASINEFDSQPTPGPYLMKAGSLWQARRIFNDSNNTLLTSILPDAESKFRTLNLLGDGYRALSVAVPSRTCREKSNKLPLAGTRIVVKDMFDIRGLRTSVGNRNFFNLYPPCTETATAIQRLIDKGAEILGKSKLSSFAAREEPTESVDYQAPFNPRGDGYQSPAGSSSGSAAAVSSYDWLDFAIGSDTTGSGRRPAHWNGCFSLRPTKTALSLEGFVKTFEVFDVPCFFGRDISKFRDFASAWYGADLQSDGTTQPISSSFVNSNVRVRGKPPRIVYPMDFMLKVGGEQKRLIDGFVKDLESALGIKRTILSLAREWEASAPENLAKQGLQEYMQNAPTHAFFYDLYHDFDKFREDFAAKYSKAPYVSPMLRWRWQIAQALTLDQREDAIERLKIFKKWFLDKVMYVDKYTSFVVFPIEEIAPKYRDEPPPSPMMPKGIGMLDIAPTLGAPELVIPVGELSYESRVSKRREFLPVAVSLMAPPGSDIGLIEMAQICLERAGRPTAVLPGSRMFKTTGDEKL